MTTDTLGPAGRGAGRAPDARSRARRGRAASCARRSCATSCYFWIGRFGGALAVLPALRRSRSPLFMAGRARATARVAGPGRAGRLVPLLHLDDPGQLVRRRRHRGQPLLPEPAAARRLPRPARARAVGGGGRPRRLGGLHRAHAGGAAHALAAARATTRCRRRSARCPPSSTMLNDLARLHRALAQEEAVRRHRGRRAQALARGPEGVLPVLPGRRHVRQGGAARARRASGCARARRRRCSCARWSR